MIIIEKIAVCCRVFNAVVRLVGDPKERNDSKICENQTPIKPCFWMFCGLGVQWLGVQWFGCSVVWVFSGLGVQ